MTAITARPKWRSETQTTRGVKSSDHEKMEGSEIKDVEGSKQML